MPYIKQDRRNLLLDEDPDPVETVGELNFMITHLCLDYLHKAGLGYDTINDIMGALSSAQAEFYRRVAVPYEDKKIKENGDVF